MIPEVMLTAQPKSIDSEITVDVDRAAELMQVSRITVIRLIHSEQLKAYKITRSERAPFRIYLHSVVDYCKAVQGRDITRHVKDLLS